MADAPLKPVPNLPPLSSAPKFAADALVLDNPPVEARVAAPSLDSFGLPIEIYQARVPIVAALRKNGYTRGQITKLLKITPGGVDWCIRKARAQGLLEIGLTEVMRELDDTALPLALESVVAALKRNDSDVALRVLEGRGVLKSYAQVKNEGGDRQGNMAFQFNFITPTGQPSPAPAQAPELAGAVVGVERAE